MAFAIGRSRIALAALATLPVFASFAIAPAEACAASYRFAAELAEPAVKRRVIASETLWRCEGQSCVTHTQLSTAPRRLCTRLVKQVGVLTGFRMDAVSFDEAQLAECNAAAR
jgi:hypothetical protein